MAHTLLEQILDLQTSETPADEIHNLFVQQFGYKQNGEYYFSPVDTNFGVRWYKNTNGYFYCYVTFDGGATETVLTHTPANTKIIVYYHVSKNEKVISLRVRSSETYLSSIIIAHDENDKTVCFYGGKGNNTPNNICVLDERKEEILKDYITDKKYKVNTDLFNVIHRYPSFRNQCLCSELYGIVNVQTFDSLSDTYINFNGQIYRVIACSCLNTATTNLQKYVIPYFAFPVSD